MTPREILQRYDDGNLTAAGAVLSVLSLTDKQTITDALELLPQELLRELKEYVESHKPELRVFRGPQPVMKTVRFAKQWFASAPRLV